MKNQKLNSAIIVLVSRSKLFKTTIELFYKNWNYKYKYPIYVHTFGKVFSNIEKNHLKKKYKNIFFEEISPRVPKHIKEKSLFYYRFYNDYAFKSFSPRRLGYLHMCNFASNINSFGKMGCLSNKLKKYDFLMRIDDDSWFKKKISYDFFKKLKSNPMATGRLTITNGDYISLTREKLFEFISYYVKKNKLKIKNKTLNFVLKQNDQKKLNLIPYSLGNFDLYNMKILKKKKFQQFIGDINKFGGIYKYRWADYDLINLFLYLHFQRPIFDFKLSKNTYEASHPLTKRITSPIINFRKISVKEIFHFFFYLIEKRLFKFCELFKSNIL